MVSMVKKTMCPETEKIVGVLIDFSDGDHRDRAVKFVAHRGYDRLLCDHVYFRFCQDCPQYECDRRSV